MADSSFASDTTIEQTIQEHSERGESEALIAPIHPKSLWFQLLYGAANLVIGIGNITFYTLLLPARIAMLASSQTQAEQTSTFVLISLVGALASILTNPIVGALSDRTTSVLGRRLPWLMVGMIVLIVAMLLLASATSLLALGIGAVLLQIAINTLLAALSAIIPDQVPLTQRATISAFGGMAPLVGGLIGQILVTQAIRNVNASFLILALVSVAILIIFSLALHEQRLPRGAIASFRLTDLPTSLWLSPRQYPDFAWMWLARCCIFLASTTVINYLFYYLTAEKVFSVQHVATGIQSFYTIYVVSLLVSSLVCGKLSDLFQHRKLFVMLSSLVMTAGLLILAFFPVWNLIIVGAVVLGLGFGGYLSVDLALASQLLPTAENRGKDFGLVNTAIFVPMFIAPALVAVAVGQFHSYAILFVAIAVFTILAAALIIPIKTVR